MKKLASGTWIDNPVMGQRALLVRLPAETGGRAFEIEYVCKPYTGKNAQPLHLHRTYTERFEILSGKARYQLGRQEHSAESGSTLVFPPGIPHLHPWSDSADELHVRQITEANPPDLDGLNASLNVGITLYGLARDGKVDRNGLPNVLQLSVSVRSTMPGTQPTNMPLGLQRIVIGFLAALGRAAGYQPTYAMYGEV